VFLNLSNTSTLKIPILSNRLRPEKGAPFGRGLPFEAIIRRTPPSPPGSPNKQDQGLIKYVL